PLDLFCSYPKPKSVYLPSLVLKHALNFLQIKIVYHLSTLGMFFSKSFFYFFAYSFPTAFSPPQILKPRQKT
ncbi:hypothetical protein, partial [Saccharibacillus qingshengii]|uniref:hypothetical protein n=1 Tax=Saccharibacillus qingshengii TaxID=1763540 RepID=UPI001C131272